MILRFLPARWRVRVATWRTDARDVVRAVREPRFYGARVVELPVTPAPKAAVARPAAAPVPAPSAAAATDVAVVVFAESGVEVVVPPGQSILDAGLANGVDLLFSCTLGGCGACMLQLVEGEVEYDDPDAICLSEDEISDGCCLACVGRPRGRIVVEA